MRLGHIQKSIIAYLNSCEGSRGMILDTTPGLDHFELRELDPAIQRLLDRNIISRWGLWYTVNKKEET